VGVLVDGGTGTTTVTGVIETIADLMNLLADLSHDCLEMNEGNFMIQRKNFDLTLFEKCPILGCYYIVIQDQSTIMDFDFANMGGENWQQEALRLRYTIQPVIEKAKKLIATSLIELQGMHGAKGIYESTFVDKVKLKYKSKGFGLGAKEPGTGAAAESFDYWFEAATGEPVTRPRR